MRDRAQKKVLAQSGEIIALGRAALNKKAPYIATTLYGLVPRPVFEDGIKLATSAKLVLYYNPSWVVSEPAFQGKNGHEVMAACLYHECCHILNGMRRLEKLSSEGVERGLSLSKARLLANIAGDLSINQMLRSAGWKLPPWVWYPEKRGYPPDLTMEQYWELLMKESSKISLSPALGSGGCGGCAGNPLDIEVTVDVDSVGRTDMDIDRIKRETVKEIRDHQKSHGVGSTPGFRSEDLIFEKRKPLVKWERKLRNVLTRCTGLITAGDDDYSSLRPDKNSALLGIILPGSISMEPEVAFIRDTSGSMGRSELLHANNEIIHAIRALSIDSVWLVDADTQAYTPKRVSVMDIPRLPVQGRGGTDFVQPLEFAKRLRPRPDIVIYMTDGGGTAPKKKPREFEVVWCVVPSRYQDIPANWGHTIICSNDRAVREQFGR